MVYTESQYLGLTRVDTRTNEKAPNPSRYDDGLDPIPSKLGCLGYGQSRSVSRKRHPSRQLGRTVFDLAPQSVDRLCGDQRAMENDGPRTVVGIPRRFDDRRRTQRAFDHGARTGVDDDVSDDGIPFYPTMTAIAESPLVEGLLYAGTDDGNVAVSHDGGARRKSATACRAFPTRHG